MIHYAVAYTVPKDSTSTTLGGPEVVRLPFPVTSTVRVTKVFSTHESLEEAQAALLLLVHEEES